MRSTMNILFSITFGFHIQYVLSITFSQNVSILSRQLERSKSEFDIDLVLNEWNILNSTEGLSTSQIEHLKRFKELITIVKTNLVVKRAFTASPKSDITATPPTSNNLTKTLFSLRNILTTVSNDVKQVTTKPSTTKLVVINMILPNLFVNPKLSPSSTPEQMGTTSINTLHFIDIASSKSISAITSTLASTTTRPRTKVTSRVTSQKRKSKTTVSKLTTQTASTTPKN